MGTERPLDPLRLVDVADGRRGGVRVDVVDLLGPHAGAFHRRLHARRRPDAVGQRRSDVKRLAAGRVAEDLRVDARPARAGVLQVFHHEHRRPLREHEPVAAPIEGPARALGLVVATGDRTRVHESGDLRRIDERIAPPREHRVARPVAHVAPRLADGVQPRGTGVADREVRAAHAEPDRHLRRAEARRDRRDVEGRDRVGPLGVVAGHRAEDRARAAVVVPEQHADPPAVLERDRQPRIVDRHHRRGDRVAREVVHAL